MNIEEYYRSQTFDKTVSGTVILRRLSMVTGSIEMIWFLCGVGHVTQSSQWAACSLNRRYKSRERLGSHCGKMSLSSCLREVDDGCSG